MNRRRLFQSLSGQAKEKGRSLGRKFGQKALDRAGARLKAKGYTNVPGDIGSLTNELKRMHREGRFSAQEWRRVRSEVSRLWKKNRP